ncbi:MAG TPA: DUF5985 family protein [Pseudolabrys sp.]|jgi:uncharacterized membrane protein YqgA involved in biofilm formation|nr:DUF5985 family protein [Pseudolabrys sp.]
MLSFLSGMVTAGFVIAALFFFRFYKRTHDSLFAILGISFVLFAINQALSGNQIPQEEHQSLIYLLRLAGFVLIIVAIVGKNLGRSKPQ